MAWRRGRPWLAFVAAVLAATAVVGSFPARQIVGQRRAQADTQQQIESVRAEIDHLSGRVDALSDPDVVKRLARERLGLVEPGQEVYRVIFPPDVAPDP